MRTALYRHFDAAGALLYVGISLNSIQRTAQHKHGARWFEQIAHITIEWHSARETALTAEAIAIAKERPKWNIAGRSRVLPPAAVERSRSGYGVAHLQTGRIDGWYSDKVDAEHMLGWLRAVFPGEHFAFVAAGPSEMVPGSCRGGLKLNDWREWAAQAPDCMAGDAYDEAAA